MNTWDNLTEQLKQKRNSIIAGGGEKRVAQQHAQGKLTARERLERLLDANTFIELNSFVKHRCTDLGMADKAAPGEGVVVGYGTIEGRLVYVFAQDFTVIGGSLGEAHALKICTVMDMAAKTGAPLIGLNDSGGARIQEGIDALNGYGEIFRRNTEYSGVFPQISVIMGPCAGGAVYSPAITDFVLMVDGTSQMFITGPQVIKAVTGETLSPEALGGATTHNQASGVAHFIGRDEDHTLQLVRQLLSYIPANNLEAPPVATEIIEPRQTNISGLVPADGNIAYDVRDVVTAVFDHDSFMEVHGLFAANAVVGFSRIDGHPVGIVANQPNHLAGCLDINASNKISRFIRFCDSFNLPVVTFVDVPGYLPGSAQEHSGIIRHGAKILYAYSEATVPIITIILRKAYGGAYVALGSKSLGADLVFAWPTAEIAVMGPAGAVNILYRKEVESAPDPDQTRQQLIQDYKNKFANPYVAAGRGLVDEVIEPEMTRTNLINALSILRGKRINKPAKKHGNIPL